MSHTLFFFGAVLLLPATIELVRLLRESHPKAASWGGVLSLMGFIGLGALDGMDFMTYVAGSGSGLATNTMQTYVDDALASIAILTSVSVVFLLLIIGLCVISVGLYRAGIIPISSFCLMPIGIIGVISFLEYPPPLIGSALLLLVSFGTVGIRQLRGAGRYSAGRGSAPSHEPNTLRRRDRFGHNVVVAPLRTARVSLQRIPACHGYSGFAVSYLRSPDITDQPGGPHT